MAGPLYREIAADLRRKINSGQLEQGSRLPTEDELMKSYRASRNTVRGALRELSTRGLVYTLHGKGTFVSEDVPPIVTTLTTDPATGGGGGEGRVYTAEVAASGRKATTSDPVVGIQKANAAVADSLRIPEGSDVIFRHEERFVDGRPWSLQTSFYPRSLEDRAPRLLDTDDISEGAVNYLRSRDIEQAGYRDSIEVRKPDPNETDFFGIPSDGRVEMTEIYRVGFDQYRNRVRLTITVYRADRNRFVINVGDVPMSGGLRAANGGESDQDDSSESALSRRGLLIMTSTACESVDRTVVPDSTSNLPAEELPGRSVKLGRAAKVARWVKSASRADSRSSWQILTQRDFRLYFCGSLISNLGTWLQSTAQVLIAYQVTRSVFIVGVIASAQFAGMVVSPWAPVLADRFSPRAVLVGTQCFSALIALLMAGLNLAGMLRVGWLLGGALGLGFAFALALPVQTALVPALVRKEDAADAVKMNSVSYNAGRALAPALCVPVILFIGPDLIFFLNAISFAIFAIVLRKLPRFANDISLRQTFVVMLSRLLSAIGSLPLVTGPRASLSRAANPASGTSAVRSRPRVRDGVIAALRHRRLLLLLAIVATVTLADDPILVLSPAVAARLHMPSASAGYFIAALGWGSVLGSLPRTSVRGNSAEHASRRAAVSLLVLGASIVLFTTGFWFPASLVAAIAAGGAALFTGTAAQTALLSHQQKTREDVAIVASVAALWAIAWAGTKPFASLLDGWLASRIGIVGTSIALTLPAISIGLCELGLPYEVKVHIKKCAERTAARIIREWISPASADAYPELSAPDGMRQIDTLPAASRVDEGDYIAALGA